MSQKLITVFGATGNQGGSVIKSLLSTSTLQNNYRIRAVTRDTSKPSAQALASQGCELVKADINDKSSIDAAVKSAYGVFAVTDYYASNSAQVEETQGRNIVDAAKSAGVKHLVWSGLLNVTKMTDGKLTGVHHFDSKAAVTDYAEQSKGDMIFSVFMPGFFMSNVQRSIQPGKDGIPTLALPWNAATTKVPMLDVNADTGNYVVGLFEAGEAANGAKVQAVSQWQTPQEIVDALKEVNGKDFKFAEIPREMFKGFMPPPVAEELTQNFELIRDYSYYGKGSEKEQDKHDKFLLHGTTLSPWRNYVKTNGVGA